MNPNNIFGVIGPGFLNQVPTLAAKPNPGRTEPNKRAKAEDFWLTWTQKVCRIVAIYGFYNSLLWVLGYYFSYFRGFR